jgi:formate dehydrogenase major subunit
MSATAWIDGVEHALRDGETVYDFVTRHRGRDAIPVLCHEPALKPFGACRLCSVEVALTADGPPRVVASCHTPAAAGQHVRTDGPRLQRLRRTLLELVLGGYPEAEQQPAPGQRPTEFQALLARYGVTQSRFGRHAVAVAEVDRSHPYLRFDAAQCVHCHRCIRACDEVQGSLVLAMRGRGHESRVIRSLDQDFRRSDCVSCGRCVQSCPTNALSDRYQAKTLIADRTVRTTCTYCGVGCNLEVLVKDGEIRAIRGADGAVNHGHTCVKGRYAFEYYRHPDRLRTPLIREQGALRPATWDEALDLVARRLGEIRAAHGPDAIAGISSARCTNEENYLMQKLMRAVVGTNNIDGCARVCHAPTAFGMQQTLGTGAATNSIDEIPLADCLLVIGANPNEAHPVTGAKIKQRAMQGVPLILIDPRAIELAPYAAVHLQPRPGTNVALLNLLLRELLDLGLTDDDFIARRTEGFAAFRTALLAEDPDRLAAIAGVDRAAVREAARL